MTENVLPRSVVTISNPAPPSSTRVTLGWVEHPHVYSILELPPIESYTSGWHVYRKRKRPKHRVVRVKRSKHGSTR